MPYVNNENYEIVFDYYLDLNSRTVKEKFVIKNKWGIKDIKNALVQKFGKEIGESFYGLPIYFGIEFKFKYKDEDNSKNKINDESNYKGIKDVFIKSIGDKIEKFDKIDKEILEFDKLSFIKDSPQFNFI